MKEILKRNDKKWLIAIVAMLVIIAILSVLLVLESKDLFYRASEETVTIIPPKRADSEVHTVGDYQYVLLEDGTVMITYYGAKNEENIVVPTTLDGKKVSAIGESAYALSVIYAKTVTVGEGITYIGKNCFFGAENAKLYLPSTLKQIENEALVGFDNPSAVYFAGTRAQWDKVKIGTGNKALSIVNCTG